MFGLRGTADCLKNISDLLKEHRVRRERLEKQPIVDLITCEKCGCAVIKGEALKGVSVIKERPLYEERSEYIYTPYYCKACPAGKKG